MRTMRENWVSAVPIGVSVSVMVFALAPAGSIALGTAERKVAPGQTWLSQRGKAGMGQEQEKPMENSNSSNGSASLPGRKAGDPPPQLSADEVRDDLKSLYTSMKSAHYDLFVHRSEREYDREYERLRSSVREPMSRLALYRLFMRFAAYGKVSHARVDFPWGEYGTYAAAGGTLFPMDLRFQNGRAYIVRNHSSDERLEPGMELVSLDGRPFAEWVERLGHYVAAERPYMTQSQMEMMFPKLLWLERGAMAKFQVGARRRGGGNGGQKAITITISAVPVNRINESYQKEGMGKPLREVKFLPNDVAYLRPGPFYDPGRDPSKGEYDPSAFGAFVDGAFGKIITGRARDLIIDIRDNPGGDNSYSDLMVAWFATRPSRFCSRYLLRASPESRRAYRDMARQPLPKDIAEGVARLNAALASHKDGERFAFPIPEVAPRPGGERFTGRVYVLINRHTYSNATCVAAQIQDYGFGKVLGEETADLPTSYASIAQFTLPRSGIRVSYPKGYFVRPSGDEKLKGVVPDFPIEFPVVTGGGNGGENATDTGLQAAVKIVLGRR